MTQQRRAGGLWCAEVLSRLSDYLDGELPDEERARVEAHLTRCDLCERFGGEMADLVRTLRHRLGERTDAMEGPRWGERFLRSLRREVTQAIRRDHEH